MRTLFSFFVKIAQLLKPIRKKEITWTFMQKYINSA